MQAIKASWVGKAPISSVPPGDGSVQGKWRVLTPWARWQGQNTAHGNLQSQCVGHTMPALVCKKKKIKSNQNISKHKLYCDDPILWLKVSAFMDYPKYLLIMIHVINIYYDSQGRHVYKSISWHWLILRYTVCCKILKTFPLLDRTKFALSHSFYFKTKNAKAEMLFPSAWSTQRSHSLLLKCGNINALPTYALTVLPIYICCITLW